MNDPLISSIVAFLVMLNPFALFLYLMPVMNELSRRQFLRVLLKASMISFVIFTAFLFFGELLLYHIFQIDFDSFRIFGGVIIFSFAYLYIVKGQRALITMKEDLDDLAAEIALPFMIGAGTLSLTIIMGHDFKWVESLLSLVIILAANFLFIVFLKGIRERLSAEKLKVAFDKNMEVLLRLFGFFVGAIGVNMVIQGIKHVFFS